MKKVLLCLALTACMAASAQDQSKNSVKPAEKKAGGSQMSMPMPKPSPEMEKLSKMMVGTWTTSEKMAPSPFAPQGATGKGTAVFKKGPGGLSLVQDYKSSNAMGSLVGHGVMWWDAQAGGYKGIWCDSGTPMGCGVNKGTANWDGDKLVGSDETEMMGQKIALKQTWTDITPNSFTLSMEGGPPGGEMKHMMTIKYTRVGAAKAETEAP